MMLVRAKALGILTLTLPLKMCIFKNMQLADYMEQGLEIITIKNEVNNNNEIQVQCTLTQNSFPYSICDITLP